MCNCIVARLKNWEIGYRTNIDGSIRHDYECSSHHPYATRRDPIYAIIQPDSPSYSIVISRHRTREAAERAIAKAHHINGDEIMQWITIDDIIYTLDTEADILEAKHALQLAGLERAAVYVGDPESPDSYPNGQILFA